MQLKLSVVTVYKFGAIEELKKTYNSILRQSYKPYELIMVLSEVENVADVKKEFNGDFVKFIINKDCSLYNAMNIGLMACNGGAVIFLNGGDEFKDAESVALINRHFKDGRCLAMRTIQENQGDFYVRPSLRYLNELVLSPAHQGFVAPLPDAKKKLYSEIKKISSDVYWMRELMERCGVNICSDVVSKFQLGGVSNLPSINTVIIRYQEAGMKRATKEIIKYLSCCLLGRKYYYRLIFFRKNEYLGVI